MFTFFSMQKFVPLRTSATVGAGSSPIAIALIAHLNLPLSGIVIVFSSLSPIG